ncbi:MAG: hypothetical protein LBU89_09495 [Fibromonadaceae bacterium]|jgi:hypothetical protein|nr:hypothetical protein [Fibromonadaceae bacterium]
MTDPVSEWILKASQLKDPIVEIADKAETLHIKINWLLLGCALQQSISLSDLRFFLLELQKEIKDVAELPAPAENLILNTISKCGLKKWSLAPQVAGIIWSVGRFARIRENRLDLWATRHSPSDLWRECSEIYYMGKNSALRPKILLFLHRLISLSPVGAGVLPPLPNSAGARRWLIKTKVYDPDENPKEKLKTVNSLYKELSPKNPVLACHALQFFAEPLDEDTFFCQQISPCNSCLVSEYCVSAI